MLTVHTPAKQKCSPVSCYFSYSAILMAAYRHGPLRERVVKSSSVSSSTGVSQFLPLRPIRYKGWSHESMKAAMKAVIDDGMSIRDAAEQYGVPRSTLGDRISGRVLPGATSGPRTFLTSDEEEDCLSSAALLRLGTVAHAKRSLLLWSECFPLVVSPKVYLLVGGLLSLDGTLSLHCALQLRFRWLGLVHLTDMLLIAISRS